MGQLIDAASKTATWFITLQGGMKTRSPRLQTCQT